LKELGFVNWKKENKAIMTGRNEMMPVNVKHLDRIMKL
jgi:hypothetical protein